MAAEKKYLFIFVCMYGKYFLWIYYLAFEDAERDQFVSVNVYVSVVIFYSEVTSVELFRYMIGYIFQWCK